MYRSNNKFLLATLLLTHFLLLCSPDCFAERADRDQPMNLEADQVTMDDVKHISTFTGKVRLSQGSLLIRGDKVILTQDKDGFKHATVYGKTAEFRQKREGFNEYVEGYGERIEYDARTETINFYEKAHLKRDRNEVSGNHITYSTQTEIFQVFSSDANSKNGPPQRVRAVLQPKPKEVQPSPATSGVLPVTPGTAPAK